MRSRYEDEAINTLFELSSKDIELRGEVVRAHLTERGDPAIEPSQFPLLEDEDQAADELEANAGREGESESAARP